MHYQKKIFITVGIVMVICALLWYFRPLPLSNLTNDNSTLLITEIELGVKDGKAYNNSTDHGELSHVQKNEILDLLENYSYKRTLGTLFSNGSLQGFGKVLHIFVYENDDFLNIISISETGGMLINDTAYKIQDGTGLIQKITELLTH